MRTLRDLQREAYDIAKSKGWHDTERSFPELIALMHSELSESLESYRDNEDAIVMRDDGKPDGYGIELTDAVIRVMDACEHLGLDLEALVMTKMAYNRRKVRPEWFRSPKGYRSFMQWLEEGLPE